jgi:hypothetical protein
MLAYQNSRSLSHWWILHNFAFRRRTVLDQSGERLLEFNRTIGQREPIAVIFGRKATGLPKSA